MNIKKNIQIVRDKILATKKTSVCLIAVSKKFSADKIEEAYSFGINDFGENYLQEALDKINTLSHLPLRWHYIGKIQTNKINKIVNKFEVIHSVSSIKILEKINIKSVGRQKIFLQVKEESDQRENGFLPNEFLNIDLDLYKNVNVLGVMHLPAPGESFEKLKLNFKKMKDLLVLKNKSQSGIHSMSSLSMGMSDDFELALECGATHLRIGSKIFGARSY